MEPQNQSETPPLHLEAAAAPSSAEVKAEPSVQFDDTTAPAVPGAFPQPGASAEPGAPITFTAPLQFEPIATAPKQPKSRSRVLIISGAVLSIAIGAGSGAIIVKHREDHNNQIIATARAAAAAKPAPLTGGVRSDGSHYGSLFTYLLPIPDGYTAGTYDANYGDNSFVPASQITSQLEDLLAGVPKSDMSSAKGALANTHLKGVAVRSLENTTSTSDLTISLELLQFDVKDAKTAAQNFDSLVSDLNVFRTGAPVPGYGQAKCVLPPGLGSDKLDEMLCVASSGDVEVLVDAQGSAPLDQNSVAKLVAQQLDRLKTSQSIDE